MIFHISTIRIFFKKNSGNYDETKFPQINFVDEFIVSQGRKVHESTKTWMSWKGCNKWNYCTVFIQPLKCLSTCFWTYLLHLEWCNQVYRSASMLVSKNPNLPWGSLWFFLLEAFHCGLTIFVGALKIHSNDNASDGIFHTFPHLK